MSLNGTDAFDRNFAPHLPEDKHAAIVDVGCGSGDFLAYLEARGHTNLRGVEIDRQRAEASRSRTGAVVDHAHDLTAYLAALPGPARLITLKSVIAHFPRERAVGYLRSMRDALEPGGTLIVETFNASRVTGPYLLFNDITHQWAYTEFSLREILEAAGFEVLSLSGERLGAPRLSTLLFQAAQRTWGGVLKAIYLVERGRGRNPAIMTKYLVAVCRRPR
jgi:SAM-dependent methyltransferase